MKRAYNKPTLKSVNLWAAEQLMANSLGIKTETETGDQSLSNEEGKHDIWGNSSNGIW